MPIYYISSSITPRDLTLSLSTWNLILTNQSHEYLKQCQLSQEFLKKYSLNCSQWFLDLFSQRLHDISPGSHPVLFDPHPQMIGKNNNKFKDYFFNTKEKFKKYQNLMKDFTRKNCQRGIRAIEYSIFGEVLFYTLQQTLGIDQYCSMVDRAWKGVYSSMLKEIVPECVRYELTQNMKDQQLQQQQYQQQQQQPLKHRFLPPRTTSTVHQFMIEDTKSTQNGVLFGEMPVSLENEIL